MSQMEHIGSASTPDHPPVARASETERREALPLRFRVGIATEVHRGSPEKGNEDDVIADAERGFAAVADGVTRWHAADGSYPAEMGKVPAHAAIEAFAASLSAAPYADRDPEDLMREALRAANEAVRRANEDAHITKETSAEEYLGTTLSGAVFRPDGRGVVGHVGDSLVLFIPADGEPLLLADDQLASWNHIANIFSYALVEHGVPARGVREWRQNLKLRLRNNAVLRERFRALTRHGAREDLAGRKDPTFGVITGAPAAVEFIQYIPLVLRPGDRLIIASDALRACRESRDGEQEHGSDYREVLARVRSLSPDRAAQEVVRLIREKEAEYAIRSDDATVAVLDAGIAS